MTNGFSKDVLVIIIALATVLRGRGQGFVRCGGKGGKALSFHPVVSKHFNVFNYQITTPIIWSHMSRINIVTGIMFFAF